MNKTTLMLVTTMAVLASVGNFFKRGILAGGYISGSPHLPAGGGYRRDKAKAPNDGRWHMKHHRNR